MLSYLLNKKIITMEETNPYFNPIPFLESLKGKLINVKLKWGHEYKGILLNYDNYMNL